MRGKFSQTRYQELYNAMREDAIASLTDGRVSVYTFDYFCNSNRLYSPNDKRSPGRLEVSCPFHHDSTPSCLIDESRWIWKCFSCGEGGSFVDFVRLYWNYTEGSMLTKAQTADRLLRQDPAMQARLGFSSVYESGGSRLVDVTLPEKKPFRPTVAGPSSYSELADWIKHDGASWAVIKFAIIMAQDGETPESIWQEIKNIKRPATAGYDLNSLSLE